MPIFSCSTEVKVKPYRKGNENESLRTKVAHTRAPPHFPEIREYYAVAVVENAEPRGRAENKGKVQTHKIKLLQIDLAIKMLFPLL